MEFKGVAVGLAQLNHVQGRRDLENLQASDSFFFPRFSLKHRGAKNSTTDHAGSLGTTRKLYLCCDGQLTFPSRVLPLQLQLMIQTVFVRAKC